MSTVNHSIKAAVFALFAATAAVLGQTPGHLSNAQPDLPGERLDPFILSIEAMKNSVAPVACLEANERETRIVAIHGSAFFTSRRGEFITAGHVLDLLQAGPRPCPIPAIFVPAMNWQPEVRDEDFVWFPFEIHDCRIQRDIDAAKCTPLGDLSVSHPGFAFRIEPVKLELSKQPDGTQVAFTGFPLHSRDPLTSRAAIATYRTEPQGAAAVSELILDHGAWAGGSGSPVYLSNGRVVGMLLERGIEQGTGIAVVRPIQALSDLVAGRESNSTPTRR